MTVTQFVTHVPLSLECPPQMFEAVRYVLSGEYESHHDGSGLEILDIGANIGSFARWATCGGLRAGSPAMSRIPARSDFFSATSAVGGTSKR